MRTWICGPITLRRSRDAGRPAPRAGRRAPDAECRSRDAERPTPVIGRP
jgi:hypothetical protein